MSNRKIPVAVKVGNIVMLNRDGLDVLTERKPKRPERKGMIQHRNPPLTNLRSLRQRRGLTVTALGRLSGVSRTQISNLEEGIYAARPINAERLAGALRTPVDALYTPPSDEPLTPLCPGCGQLIEEQETN